VFDVTGVSMNPMDSLQVRIKSGGNLELASHGTAHEYDLQVTDAASTGTAVFGHTHISLPANSTHRIEPGWDDLANQMVKILIDHGNHGSFDDSLLVKNQVTGVGPSPGGSTQPGGYWLAQNYPNPFNPATVIEYHLAASQPVTLEVFNLLGQRVASLVDGVQTQGTHRVAWTPGGSVASGVYYYRLRAGTYSSIHKMLLVR
ncbi:MAG TPA: T9SS type A sorting domain-containing protein, partial [Bacteroidota bacterium]|nr:T9SS type A sorting domain-containing protein [Bacteroidota bacterium]